MATRAQTIDSLRDALPDLPLTARKMFGEYALFLDGKVVALVCDDQLVLKPTPGAMAALPDCPTGQPYPGAKPHLLVTDALDDPDPVATALRAIARDLPDPAPKRPRKLRSRPQSFPVSKYPTGGSGGCETPRPTVEKGADVSRNEPKARPAKC